MTLKMIFAGTHEKPSKSSVGGLTDVENLKKDASPIRKTEREQQLVWAEVYVPNTPDAHGHFMRAEAIQKMAYNFLVKGGATNIDVEHDTKQCGAHVVESFIARKGDPDFIEGSWVLGVKVPDNLWPLVKSGALNGFSFMGMGQLVDHPGDYEVSDLIKGETTETADHNHTFEVRYSEDGVFLGGATGPGPDGHVHLIKGGTRTEEVNGHSHRFAFVEGVLSLEAE